MKRIVSIILLFALVLPLLGCASQTPNETIGAVNLLEDITPDTLGHDVEYDPTPGSSGVPGFGVRLFQNSLVPGENTLISPISVLFALAMTANGAKGETLEQMEAVLGMPVSALNPYLEDFAAQVAEKQGSLKLANSIWFTDDKRFTVEKPFLQTVANYYDADIYQVPFDDVTCRDINSWVNKKTDGMIPEILDQIPQEAVMYLVNALAFEAKWPQPYEESQVLDGEFTKENGEKLEVEMLHGEESLYLELGNSTGFMKLYKGGDYAFVALLPTEGTVAELVATLDGTQLVQLLENPTETTVLTAIPKFETGYSAEMSEILQNMGMTHAFNGTLADFSGLGSSIAGNIFISRVLHKTYLSLGEQGTKAGAATLVEMRDECAVLYPQDTKTVVLDRPFVYMIVDTDSWTPLFMGTMMDPA